MTSSRTKLVNNIQAEVLKTNTENKIKLLNYRTLKSNLLNVKHGREGREAVLGQGGYPGLGCLVINKFYGQMWPIDFLFGL